MECWGVTCINHVDANEICQQTVCDTLFDIVDADDKNEGNKAVHTHEVEDIVQKMDTVHDKLDALEDKVIQTF